MFCCCYFFVYKFIVLFFSSVALGDETLSHCLRGVAMTTAVTWHTRETDLVLKARRRVFESFQLRGIFLTFFLNVKRVYFAFPTRIMNSGSRVRRRLAYFSIKEGGGGGQNNPKTPLTSTFLTPTWTPCFYISVREGRRFVYFGSLEVC